MKRLWQKKNRIWLLLAVCFCLVFGLTVQNSFAYFVNERRAQTIVKNEMRGPEWQFFSDITIVEPVKEELEEVIEDENNEIVKHENGLSILADFTEAWPMLLEINYPENSDYVEIGLNEGKFPTATYYSEDGLKGHKLDGEDYIRITSPEAGKQLLLIFMEEKLDFPEYTLQAVFYDSEGNEIVSETEGALPERDIWGFVLNSPEPVLRDTGVLTWNIISPVAELSYEVSLEYLTIDGYAKAENLVYDIEEDEDTGNSVLQISNEEGKTALAGTYQISITQVYSPEEGLVMQLQEMVIPFFVNYR